MTESAITDGSEGDPPTAYLDMNVVGDIAGGSLALPPKNIRYVYSSEHFNEIARGSSTFLLDTLAELGAYELVIDLDEHSRITDRARLQFNSDIRARYADHLATYTPGKQHVETFMSMIALYWGADNSDVVLEAVTKLPENILPAGLRDRNPAVVEEANRVSVGLLAALQPSIHRRMPLEKMRRSIGSSRAQTKDLPPDQVIPELWRRISGQIPGTTLEQVFGIDPVDKQGYEKWPTYLAIIGCHGMLNTLGYRPDKGMARETRTSNILSDGAHIASAAFCNSFWTADRRLSEKASAIYAFLRIGTLVCQLGTKDASE